VERGVRQGCVISPLLFNLYSEFMMMEAMEGVDGIIVGGGKRTDIRYADDAVLMANKRKKMQDMLNKLNDTCKVYGMDINVKKTKYMVINEREDRIGMKRNIVLDGVPIEQVTRFKYLGSWITEDVKCDEDVKARVGLAKTAFWQNKEIMRRNVRLQTKMKILTCYVFSILNYGCESWTWHKAMYNKVNAFEMWCYRRILKISWRDRVTNREVLGRMETGLHFVKDMMRRKCEYAGHVLRGSSGLSHLQMLEGRMDGKRKQRRPIRIWTDDLLEWTGLRTYGMVKREAEDRERWKLIVVNL
jgi:hypothetical protein